MRIVLRGEPRSTQNIYRCSCSRGYPKMYMSDEGRDLKEDYQWQIASQYHGDPITDPLRVTATFYFRSGNKHDLDNFNKLLLDAGNGTLWEDDSQIEELHLYKLRDTKDPRIEVDVEPFL